MRLLTLQEQKEQENIEEKIAKRKLNQLNEAITREIKSFNELKEKYFLEKERIRAEHQEFLTEMHQKKSGLGIGITIFEERKNKALIPLSGKEKTLKEKEHELEEKESSLKKREDKLALKNDEVYELADKYEERFGELTDFANELKVRKDRLDEEVWKFNAHMKYRETAIANNHKKLRAWFEAESDKLKKLKEIKS